MNAESIDELIRELSRGWTRGVLLDGVAGSDAAAGRPLVPGMGEEAALLVASSWRSGLYPRSGEETTGRANSVDSKRDGAGILGRIGKSLVSGFGVASLLSGLLGRGGEDHPTSRVPFLMPETIQANLGYDARSQSYSEVDYGAGMVPRSLGRQRAPEVNITVQAMDSKSFSDRSADIARAVKEALLDSHSLGDFLSEL